MKVVTATGAIELGATADAVTIGITDYSRRVTDDFGVTTVVRRGFSRTLSANVALPFEDVDRVQRVLAGLRAASAQWIADDRFAWAQPTGYFKDFSLDLATPPLSHCSLTIEGLAETEAGADTGGDPAPAGVSTLRVLRPIDVTDAMLTSNVLENDAPAWSASVTYAKGAAVISGHRVYESVAADNLGHDPATSTQWLDTGPTSRWAMFDAALGTATAGPSISVTIAAAVGAVALLDVIGAQVRVRAAGYDRTVAVGAGAVVLDDLPGGGSVTVDVTGSGQVSVGTMLVGSVVGLGLTAAAPTAGITDYSRKSVDDFGEVTIVERAWSKRMSTRASIRTDAVDLVANRIAGLRARPCLWLADDAVDALAVFGFFKEFSIEITSAPASTLSLSVEGLSKAADVAPLTVDWSNVTGANKPQDNATVGAPIGTQVGGVAVVKVIDAIKDDAGNVRPARDLVAEAKAASDAAIAAANTEIDRVRSDLDSAKTQLASDVTAAQSAVDAAKADAKKANDDLASEIVRARAAEGTINTAVEAAQNRADGAFTAISTETTQRSTADIQLSQRIDTVESTATTDRTNLNSRITQEVATLVTRDNATAARQDVVEATLKKTPTSYLACGYGNPARFNNRVPDGLYGLYDGAGNLLVGPDRSYVVHTFKKSDNSLDVARHFDVYGDTNASKAMADYLNSLPNGTGVVVITYDEPFEHRLENGLPAAMERCGAGDLFSSSSFMGWSSYILLGYAGAGRSGGQEFYKGAVTQDLEAWLQQPFSVLNGRPLTGSDRQAATVNARVTSEASASASRDTAIGQRVDAVIAQANSDRNATGAAIQSEAVTRAGETGALSNRIDSVIAQANTDRGDYNAKINSEQTARAAVDQALSNKVDTVEAQLRGDNDSGLAARIRDEATVRAGADAAAATRISATEANYTSVRNDLNNWNNDRYQDYVRVDARVAREENIRTSETGALSSRIGKVETSYSGAGNLLGDTEFTTTAGWAMSHNGGGMNPLTVHTGGDWCPPGESVLYLDKTDAIPDDDTYTQVTSDLFAVAGDSFLQFYGRTANHRCKAWISLFFYDQDGNWAGYAGGYYAPRSDNGGRDLNGWDYTGLKSVRVPASARSARFAWRIYGKGIGNPVAWLFHPYVGQAREGQTEWNPYSPGSGKQSFVATNARITDEANASANRDNAISDRISDTEAKLNGGQDSWLAARVRDEATASANRDNAIGQRQSITETRLSLTPRAYRVVARGNSASIPNGGVDAGLYDGAGVRIGGGVRSYNVAVFEPTSNDIVAYGVKTYDIYGDPWNADNMRSYLAGFPAGYTVVIWTFDEPRNNRTAHSLLSIMEWCGAGPQFSNNKFSFQGAYILIGRTGIGKGNGQEFYAGGVDADPSAYLDTTFQMLNGRVMLGSGGIATVDAKLSDEVVARSNETGALTSRMASAESKLSLGQGSEMLSRIVAEETTRSDQIGALTVRSGALEARAGSLEARTTAAEGSLVNVQSKVATAWSERTVSAGAGQATIGMRAIDANGQTTSNITMSAASIALLNNENGAIVSGGLYVSGGQVVVDGTLSARAGIFVGTAKLPIQIGAFDRAVSDGTAVSYGYDLGRAPTVTFGPCPVALAAGEVYQPYAENLNGTGFVARLRIISAPQSSAQSVTNFTQAGDGSWSASLGGKPLAANGQYTVNVSVWATATAYRERDDNGNMQ